MNLIRLAFNTIGLMGGVKDLARRTASDKVLGDKAFNIAKYPKYDGYQRGLASMVYKFFDKKSKQLVKELHKTIIRNFFKKYSLFGV